MSKWLKHVVYEYTFELIFKAILFYNSAYQQLGPVQFANPQGFGVGESDEGSNELVSILYWLNTPKYFIQGVIIMIVQ